MRTTDAFTRGKSLIEAIIRKMDGINQWQSNFVQEIFLLCLGIRGRFNFLQMGREGSFHEQTFRNQFAKAFSFLKLNVEMVKSQGSGSYILAFDPSYIRKSGKLTPGLGYFYSGCASRYERGLEIGGLAAVDLKQHTAWHLEAIQTPSARKDKIADSFSLIDHYAQVVIQQAEEAKELSDVLVVDGYFCRSNFINPVCKQTGLHLISRLRDDANLKFLYQGTKKRGRGRPKKYDGKVNVKNIDKRRFRKRFESEEMIIYSACVYSVSLRRVIKVAYVEFISRKGQVPMTKMFFSTDLSMEAEYIVECYRMRFQIEFLYRDAKQHTGLEHCQARDNRRLYYHFNTSLTSVSVGKALLRNNCPKDVCIPLSISDIKTELHNRNIIHRIFSMYGLAPDLIKNKLIYERLLNYGKIAA